MLYDFLNKKDQELMNNLFIMREIEENIKLEECTICFEMIGLNKKTLKCEHQFHLKCLKIWLKINDKCPICKKTN